MVSEVLYTKFGNAKLNNKGYYMITSRKEGNNGKLLHRLIFEDYYQINLNEEFPNGVVIHHEDEDKANNNLWNLIPMPHEEHMKIHMTGEENPMRKGHSLDDCKKISKHYTSTGYFRVYKYPDKSCKQGFIYRYSYFENGRRRVIGRVNILKLKEVVLSKGLEWVIVDELKAKMTCDECGVDYNDL